MLQRHETRALQARVIDSMPSGASLPDLVSRPVDSRPTTEARISNLRTMLVKLRERPAKASPKPAADGHQASPRRPDDGGMVRLSPKTTRQAPAKASRTASR